jgi:hypothetical protein
MSNVKLAANIAFTDGIVNAMVVVQGTEADLPASNLITRDRYKICRATPSGGSADVFAVLEDDQSIGAIGIFGLNLTSSATARCQLIDSGDNVVWDSGTAAIFPAGAGYTLPKASRSAVWWADQNYTVAQIKITLTDTETYFDLARVAFGAAWSPDFNPGYENLMWSWKGTADYTRTQGGTGRAATTDAWRRVQWSLQHLTELQRNQIALYLQQAGQSMLLSQHPGEGGQLEYDNQMLCYLVDQQDLIPVYPGAWAANLIFEEI